MLIGSTLLMTSLILTCPFILHRIEKKDNKTLFVQLLLVVYIATIMLLTLGIRSFDEKISINIIPFQCYRGLANQLLFNWRTYNFRYNTEQFRIIVTGICNIVINIVLLMPFGYLVPLAFPKRKCSCKKMILIGCGTSLIIEIVQLLTHRGCFDLDDLFHNTIGVVLGFVMGKYVELQ